MIRSTQHLGERKWDIGVCPDCGAVPVEGTIKHAESCPVGVGIDEVCAEDREWFAAHLGDSQRRRQISWAEGVDMKVMGYMPDVAGEWSGDVVVTQLSPGVRTRSFTEVFFVPDDQEMLRAELEAGGAGIIPVKRVEQGVETLSFRQRIGSEMVDSDRQRPFDELPAEVAQVVDKALADGSWTETWWEGRKIIVVSDTHLAHVVDRTGEQLQDAVRGAWVLERGDGRKAYVWSAPGGTYGMGKATLA